MEPEFLMNIIKALFVLSFVVACGISIYLLRKSEQKVHRLTNQIEQLNLLLQQEKKKSAQMLDEHCAEMIDVQQREDYISEQQNYISEQKQALNQEKQFLIEYGEINQRDYDFLQKEREKFEQDVKKQNLLNKNKEREKIKAKDKLKAIRIYIDAQGWKLDGELLTFHAMLKRVRKYHEKVTES
jgi:cell division FtsZ-interacting protein ZapD